MSVDIDVNILTTIAEDAGEAIMEIYKQDFEVEHKADDSPLTAADKAANEVIMEGLSSFYPDVPVISEENKSIDYADRKDWNTFWLVDPLDGTKEFIKKNGEFTVNIALIENGAPVFGVVHIPAQGVTFYGKKGEGAFRIADGTITKLDDKPTHYSDKQEIKVVASRSHLSKEVEEFVEELRAKGKQVNFVAAGSSLKFCLIAEGKADVYPRFGPTMEWDTGAAHAVAEAAGRKVVEAESKTPLQYNKENLLNPWFIVE